MDAIAQHEQDLIAYVFPQVRAVEGLTIYETLRIYCAQA